MPTYEYRCTNCEHRMEAFHKITDKPLQDCPKCHQASLTRGPGGGIGLSFVGTGWYKTDYSGTSSKDTVAPPSAESKPKEPCCPCGKSKGSCT